MCNSMSGVFFMFGIDINNTIVVQQKQVLEAALSTNPKTKKALQKLINKVLWDARQQTVSNVKHALGSDPRGAVHSIRRIVYKQLLGAELNIRNMKREARGPISYEPTRKLDQNPRQRGGNRVPRGRRTNDVMHYGPTDRGWILRIVNSGTDKRTAGTRDGVLHGNRGSIAPRNFFKPAASRAIATAADRLSQMIDTELEAMLQKSK